MQKNNQLFGLHKKHADSGTDISTRDVALLLEAWDMSVLPDTFMTV